MTNKRIVYLFPNLFKIEEFSKENKKFVRINHPGAVAVLLIKRKNFVLIEEYRPVINRTIFSVPTGKIKKRKSALTTAKREVEEKTGLIPKNLKIYVSFF